MPCSLPLQPSSRPFSFLEPFPPHSLPKRVPFSEGSESTSWRKRKLSHYLRNVVFDFL